MDVTWDVTWYCCRLLTTLMPHHFVVFLMTMSEREPEAVEGHCKPHLDKQLTSLLVSKLRTGMAAVRSPIE